MIRVAIILAIASSTFSLPTTTTPSSDVDLPTTTIPPPEEIPTVKPVVVELLNIAGADIQRAVFHQKHTIPDGTVIGTYGYFDSREKYHVLNYVNDAGGLRVISDYTPFDPLPGSASSVNKVLKPVVDDFDDVKAESSVLIETKETRETHILNKKDKLPVKTPEIDPLVTGDGDNLLRDEHSIIRTHALPPPGHHFLNGYYGHHSGFQGLDSAAFPQAPPLPVRPNGTRRYNQVYNSLFYGNQGNHLGYQGHAVRRIPLPYENPLYPLLYGDREKLGVHSETERGDEINDTSGLDATDAGEVPSNPGKVEFTSQTIHNQEGASGLAAAGHYGEAGHVAVGQVAGSNHIGGHVSEAGHLGSANYGVLAQPTTIHHGYAGNHYSGNQGYHQGYFQAPQVSTYYHQGYYPQNVGSYGGHHQAGFQANSRYYAPQGGYAQSHRYYYRYPSHQYGYSQNYQG